MIMKEILKCPIKLKDKTHNIYVKENSKIQISSHCNTGLTQLILKQNKTKQGMFHIDTNKLVPNFIQ